MAEILCIDTEADTIEALRSDGHRVDEGSIGYLLGNLDQPYDPRGYDFVVCDLRRPTCFDNESWIAAGRSIESYAEMKGPGETYQRVAGRLVPSFQLIRRDRMRKGAGRHFNGDDVLDAVTNSGTQVILFLNPEWIRHLDEEFPDWVALAWKFQKANARKVYSDRVLKAVLPEIDAAIPLRLPLREQIVAGPLARSVAEISWDFELVSSFQKRTFGCRSRSLVGTPTSQCFGQMVRTGSSDNGAIWALPRFKDNTAAARLLVSRLDSVSLRRIDAA